MNPLLPAGAEALAKFVRRSPRYVALIPAAGSGSRLAGETPKQYLKLGSKTMLEHSIDSVRSDPRVTQVVVVISPQDRHAAGLRLPQFTRCLPVGGATRAASVRAGLDALVDELDHDDRILVHDAARPCLQREQLARLLDEAGSDDEGGLLAVPLTDTLKRADDSGRSQKTLDRSHLWCAQTPQLFRFAALRAALAGGDDSVTDEAAAMERAGHAPRLVPGVSSNLKVTTGDDLALAHALLEAQGRI